MGASTDALVRLEVLLDRLARERVALEARARRRVRQEGGLDVGHKRIE
jgi:hypothetical protein